MIGQSVLSVCQPDSRRYNEVITAVTTIRLFVHLSFWFFSADGINVLEIPHNDVPVFFPIMQI